jgi:hypothetical protein
VVALAASIALAWWQWSRFESANGTFQNLGYVLQWPLFGLFPAFAVWRWRRLRHAEQAKAAEPAAAPAPPAAPRLTPKPAPKPAPTPTPTPEQEPDDELAAYNRFLAQLNARDQQETR